MQYKLLHRESKQSKIQSEKFNSTIISRLLKTKSAISKRILEYSIDQDNTPYLIMDYASQEMLRNRSPKGSIVPLQTATSYVKQIAEALQYARDRNLIHRCFHRYVFAVSKMDKNLEKV